MIRVFNTCMHARMYSLCVHVYVCRDQRTMLGVVHLSLAKLLFETQSLTGLGSIQVISGWW